MMRTGWGCSLLIGSLLAASVQAAVPNGSFIATWDVPTDPRGIYEFRWRSFAQGEWQPLPDQEARALSFRHAFPPLPPEPATDRWMCLDARSRIGEAVGPWLSEIADGAACNSVEVGTIPVPPIPPVEVFSHLTNNNGVLSFDYRLADCPSGVSKSTGAARNGQRTITLRCRK